MQFMNFDLTNSLFGLLRSYRLIVFATCLLRILQVNLFQKLWLLNQLTHNITRDCSLNSPKNTSSQHVVFKYCFECQNKNKITILVHNMLSCIFRGIQWTISFHNVGWLMQEWELLKKIYLYCPAEIRDQGTVCSLLTFQST